MTATRQDIEWWVKSAQNKGASHVIIVHDTFDNDNFPLYIMPGEDPREVFNEKYIKDRKPCEAAYAADECYDLSLNIQEQLQERRAHHWEKWPSLGLIDPTISRTEGEPH